MKEQLKNNKDSVFINGTEYVPANSISGKTKESTEGLPYVCIRTYSAGVHFGFLKHKESTLAGMEVTLINSQRMRYWEGAMDLSVLSQEGSSKPEKCKPSLVLERPIQLLAIEIIEVSEKAFESIKSMPIWK